MAEPLEALIARERPRLHRYCARMLGSAFDGEDVVQEALAKALMAWPDGGIERPEAWLFRIAHNTALDELRRRKRGAMLEAELMATEDGAESGSDARVAASANLAAFLPLPAAQRACAILVDVLGYSLDETGDITGLTLPTTKAALHRARAHLREHAHAEETAPRALSDTERERLRNYADRFNARDFDALRALLAADVKLDLVNRARLASAKDVSIYFTRYAEAPRWRVEPGIAEGRPVLLVSDREDPTGGTKFVVLLGWADDAITTIRDFCFAPYIMDGLTHAALRG